MRPGFIAATLSLGSCLAVASLIACAATPRSSRLTTEDFTDFAVELSARLGQSDFLRSRGPDSPPMIVSVSRVENLSTDLLSEGERWYLMDRVIDSRTMDALARQKNIRFVIPAEKLELLRARLEAEGRDVPIASGRAPTHAMTARLRSITRTAGRDRTDLYDFQAAITTLADGATVWTDTFAIKRIAAGRSYN